MRVRDGIWDDWLDLLAGVVMTGPIDEYSQIHGDRNKPQVG